MAIDRNKDLNIDEARTVIQGLKDAGAFKQPVTGDIGANSIDTNQLETKQPTVNVPKADTVTPSEPFIPVAQPVEGQSQEATDNAQLKKMIFDETVDSGTKDIAAAEEKFGLQAKTEDLTAIEGQILQTTEKFRAVREGISTRAGSTAAQKNAELGDVTRRQNSEIADLEVTRFVRQGAFRDAQAAVDRKVEFIMADKKARLDGLTFLYKENKEILTRDEQRQFEDKIRKEDREYTKEYDQFKTLEDMKLHFLMNAAEAGQGNAYLQGIQGATTKEELLGISGIGTYSTSKAERLSNAINNKKLSDLQNPKAVGVDIKALSGEQAKTLTGATGLYESIDYIQEKLRKTAEEGGDLVKISLQQLMNEDPTFDRHITMAIDSLGRLKSGGAINEEEVKAFKKLILSKKDMLTHDLYRTIEAMEVPKSFGYSVAQMMDPTGGYRDLARKSGGIQIDEDGNIVISGGADTTNEDFFN